MLTTADGDIALINSV